MASYSFHTQGLTSQQVLESRARYGFNKIDQKKEGGFLIAARSLFKEPMFVLLLLASTIYFISGKTGDGIFMVVAIILVAAISFYQESRSRNAIDALRKLTQPYSKVIRNGMEVEVPIVELVVGDYVIVEEGRSIPADGVIIQSNDFSVNEAILTGESLPVNKSQDENNQVFQGTTVMSGLAICKVEAIGNQTKLGKIGKSLEQIEEEETPLQIQIGNFVKKMALIGMVIFLIVWVINFSTSRNFLDSLLKSLTLAMSILPEEIPVAFTTFMALGAWRLMKLGIIVKQTKTVETLGSATVICIDKTGTITENKMTLAKLYVHAGRKTVEPAEQMDNPEKQLIRLAMWSSEPIPFDPMEVALHEAYSRHSAIDERTLYKLIFEYPLEGRPPMMTHVFENEMGQRIIAAKGAPEALFNVSNLSESERAELEKVSLQFSSEGYRVLGVGMTEFSGNDFHARQQQYKFQFVGLVAFHDPPKENIKSVLDSFYDAGIRVKMITGDNAATSTTIGRQVGFRGIEKNLRGEELMDMSEAELEECVLHTDVFTRMFPEAKLRIINALKAKGEIVAMTGDGVNDGPALKAAHIGISMGKKGSEIARQASSLILMDDDLSRMVDAIAMGRKIYTNLKKAIQYIISIHIPIILIVFLPLALGWIYPSIFSPIHIIFLELIMGPTCSIIYENEPLEKNVMQQKPRPFTTTFFNFRELLTSIFQGLVITLITLIIYQYAVQEGSSEAVTRTMVFTTLISANVFLTLVNRSFYYSVITTASYRNKLVPLIIVITISITGLLLYADPLTRFFEFQRLSWIELSIAISAGFFSVIWFEVIKWLNRNGRL
jgi:Ca2+-transporting ATPase